MHLGNTTKRVRVLYMFFGTGYQLTSMQQATEYLSRLNLTGMGTNLLNTLHKRIDAPIERFK